MLEFVRYEFEQPKFDVDECQQRGMTYAAPLKVTLRLIVFEIDPDTQSKSVKDIKEQDVYMGDMPLMTANGTFVVNGTERVIVSQMHRSPGVFFDHDKGKTHSRASCSSRPHHSLSRLVAGLRVRCQGLIFARIDRRRKLPITTLLYALGLGSEEILHTFYKSVTYTLTKTGWKTPFDAQRLRNMKPAVDLIDAKTGQVVVEAGKKITPRLARKIAEDGVTDLLVQDSELSRSLPCRRTRQRKDWRNLCRGRRRDHREAARRAEGGGLRPVERARHRPHQHRPLHPQHAQGRQGREL